MAPRCQGLAFYFSAVGAWSPLTQRPYDTESPENSEDKVRGTLLLSRAVCGKLDPGNAQPGSPIDGLRRRTEGGGPATAYACPGWSPLPGVSLALRGITHLSRAPQTLASVGITLPGPCPGS